MPVAAEPVVGTIRRDVFRERAWTMHACLGIVGTTELIADAERRAASLSSPYVSDPMTIRQNMDRPREVTEELLDGRNHLVFLMQERELTTDEERDCLIALRHIAMAYDVLRRLD